MKLLMTVTALSMLALTACAMGPRISDDQRLGIYREHAGESVGSFHYFGSISSWMPLGDSALAVWTRPNKAYLLELFAPCSGLEYTPAISITEQFGTVSAGFDKVIVHNDPGFNIPCRIDQIRPLDVDEIDSATDALRAEIKMVEREQTSGKTTSDASAH